MIVLDISIGLVVLAVLAASVRIARGPTNPDRAVAADLLFFSIIALIALVGLRVASAYVFDILLIATLTGFLATLSLARAITKGRR